MELPRKVRTYIAGGGKLMLVAMSPDWMPRVNILLLDEVGLSYIRSRPAESGNAGDYNGGVLEGADTRY